MAVADPIARLVKEKIPFLALSAFSTLVTMFGASELGAVVKVEEADEHRADASAQTGRAGGDEPGDLHEIFIPGWAV